MNKTIKSILTEIIRELERWHWPGNIRELENFIERSAILTPVTVCGALNPSASACTTPSLSLSLSANKCHCEPIKQSKPEPSGPKMRQKHLGA